MRAARDAPVDRLGPLSLADPTADEKTRRFQILLSLMLSSQTKDEITGAAMERLKTSGCTVEGILQLNEEQIRNLIYPVGFYKRYDMKFEILNKFYAQEE